MSRPRAATSVATSRSAVPAAQPAHHPVALLLAHAAVQRLGPVAAAVQRLGELVDLLAGAAEDDRRGRATRRRAPGPARPACAPAATTYALCRTRGASPGDRPLAADLDPDRVAAGAGGRCRRSAAASWPRTAPSAAASGRARRGSPRCPRRSPCRASRRPRRARPWRARRGRRVPRAMWSSARPGRGDDDVDAAVQRPQLPADRLPAVDRQHPGAQVLAVAVERLGDLHGQLAGGHQHQRHRVAARPVRRACRCSSGSANAAVLPVPVAAWPEQVPALPAAAGSPPAGSASAPRSRGRRARPAARRAARDRRRRSPRRCRRGWRRSVRQSVRRAVQVRNSCAKPFITPSGPLRRPPQELSPSPCCGCSATPTAASIRRRWSGWPGS